MYEKGFFNLLQISCSLLLLTKGQRWDCDTVQASLLVLIQGAVEQKSVC